MTTNSKKAEAVIVEDGQAIQMSLHTRKPWWDIVAWLQYIRLTVFGRKLTENNLCSIEKFIAPSEKE